MTLVSRGRLFESSIHEIFEGSESCPRKLCLNAKTPVLSEC